MLQIKDLAYTYPASSRAPTSSQLQRSPRPQLRVSEFTLEAGAHAVVLGPSGSGKSTLLHLIAAILKPQQGILRVGTTDLEALTPRDADAWRGATIGFIPQKLALVPSLSARENVLLAAYACSRDSDHRRADKLLDALGLKDQANAKPHEMSQGQRQRVALARALYNGPALLLADEPTSNLDDIACAAAIQSLSKHADDAGASLLVATHDARVLAALPEAGVLRLPAMDAESTP